MDALERLKAACSMASVKRQIPMPNGSTFDFYSTPLTLAEKAVAQNSPKGNDPTEFGLRLLINKAKDENGELLFHVGHLPGLRNSLPADVVEKIMVSFIEENKEDEQEEVQKEISLKSDKPATKKRQRITS